MPLPIVDPTEQVLLEFDFTELLTAYVGSSITGQRLTIDVISGADATPTSRFVGAPSIAALIVTQLFDPDPAWASEQRYRATCNIDVSGTSYKPTIAIEVTVNKRTDA